VTRRVAARNRKDGIWSRPFHHRSRLKPFDDRHCRRQSCPCISNEEKEFRSEPIIARLQDDRAAIPERRKALLRLPSVSTDPRFAQDVSIFLDAIEQLAKTLSASDTKAACLKLAEFIDGIVVAPRLKPGDPIHLRFAGV